MLGTRSVLRVVDGQRGFGDPSWGRCTHPCMEALLAVWRATDRLTIQAKHCFVEPSPTLRPGQSRNEHKPCAVPSAGEPMIAEAS